MRTKRWTLTLTGLLLLAAGCEKEGEWQTFPGEWEDAEHLNGWILGILPEEAKVTVIDTDCDDPGIFLRIDKMDGLKSWEDSVVYSHNDWLLPFKNEPGKKLLIKIIRFDDSLRHPFCGSPDSTVHGISLEPEFKELN